MFVLASTNKKRRKASHPCGQLASRRVQQTSDIGREYGQYAEQASCCSRSLESRGAALFTQCRLSLGPLEHGGLYVYFNPMDWSMAKRGRPATGHDIPITARLDAAAFAAVKKFATAHKLNRSEAVRELINLGLQNAAAYPQTASKTKKQAH